MFSMTNRQRTQFDGIYKGDAGREVGESLIALYKNKS